MNNIFTTGNSAVDEISQINFSGNIIPQTWYKSITKKDNKPYLLAIILLSDIVYWYRPKEIRDETTGELMGYRKKFHSDLLQRSYDSFAEQFGCSKGQIQSAVVFLEEMGVIKRVFRTEIHNGVRSNNILYIALNAGVLKALTYPQSSEEKGTAMPKNQNRLPRKSGIAISENPDTNTENITEINVLEITPSIHQEDDMLSDTLASIEMLKAGAGEEELKGQIYDEIASNARKSHKIPYAYLAHDKLVEITVRILAGYDEENQSCKVYPNTNHDSFEQSVFLLFVNALTEMLLSKTSMCLRGAYVTSTMVYEKLNEYIGYDEYCYYANIHFLQEKAVGDFITRVKNTDLSPIKDNMAYMKSCIWNAMQCGDIELMSLLKRNGHI